MSSKFGEIMSQLSNLEIGPEEEEEIRSGLEKVLSNMSKVAGIISPLLTQYMLDIRHGVLSISGALFETITDDTLMLKAVRKKAMLDANYLRELEEYTGRDFRFTSEERVAIIAARNRK